MAVVAIMVCVSNLLYALLLSCCGGRLDDKVTEKRNKMKVRQGEISCCDKFDW